MKYMSPSEWKEKIGEQTSSGFVYRLRFFNPIKVNGQIFGEQIEFNNAKRHIKFSSKFHYPDYLNYDQIKRITIEYDRKNWLILVGAFTLIIVVGFMMLYAWASLPPWKITLEMKHQEPITIRVRLLSSQPQEIVEYCEGVLACEIIEKKGRKKKKTVEV